MKPENPEHYEDQPSSVFSTSPPVPFLKWAGGKTQLLPFLEPFFPKVITRYCEPFLGGGAVFFYLRGQGRLTGEVVLADINVELINAYRAVQMNVVELVALLDLHKAKHCREYYYQTRAAGFTEDLHGAARTIYLNKTSFNGLYRVNSRGEFNAPLGDYKNPRLYDGAAIRQASQALQGVTLLAQHYKDTLALFRKGDVVYLDPPYLPLSNTSSFTGYTPGGFDYKEHEQLANSVFDCHQQGMTFVLSNSHTVDVAKLYSLYHTHVVPARRNINCMGKHRTCIHEVIITNAGI